MNRTSQSSNSHHHHHHQHQHHNSHHQTNHHNSNSNQINKSDDASTNAGSSSTSNTNSQQQQQQQQQSLSNLMIVTNESIKLMAESIGITNLSDDACRELVSDLTFTVKSILIDAQKLSRRSRRKKLISSDIDYSLKARLIEPIYGFQSHEQIPYRSATLPGGVGGGRSLYYVDEQSIDLNDLIANNNQTIKLPNDLVINAHWLAIEGVQPSVPENPQLVSRDMQKKEALEGVPLTKLKDKSLAQQQQQQQQQRKQFGENLVKLKSLVPHDLSVEQQIYFKEITEACVGSDEQKRTEALNSLTTDPGLHQLLPRIVLFVSEGVRLNIVQTNMAILIYLMRMAKALIENKSIYLEKYLHELIPSIMSCVLSKQVCSRPEVENHCALREFCARLIGQIIKTYSPTIPSLQPRIVKIYLSSIQSDKTSFSTLFGAIAGLSEIGNEICESFVFPLVKMIGERIAQILDSTASQVEKLPAEKVKQLLTKIIANILKTKPSGHSQNEFDYLASEFGAYLGPLIHSQLMKLRNQQLNVAHAQQMANKQTRTIINPQFNRAQSLITNQSSPALMTNQTIITTTRIESFQPPSSLSSSSSSSVSHQSTIVSVKSLSSSSSSSTNNQQQQQNLQATINNETNNASTASSKSFNALNINLISKNVVPIQSNEQPTTNSEPMNPTINNSNNNNSNNNSSDDGTGPPNQKKTKLSESFSPPAPTSTPAPAPAAAHAPTAPTAVTQSTSVPIQPESKPQTPSPPPPPSQSQSTNPISNDSESNLNVPKIEALKNDENKSPLPTPPPPPSSSSSLVNPDTNTNTNGNTIVKDGLPQENDQANTTVDSSNSNIQTNTNLTNSSQQDKEIIKTNPPSTPMANTNNKVEYLDSFEEEEEGEGELVEGGGVREPEGPVGGEEDDKQDKPSSINNISLETTDLNLTEDAGKNHHQQENADEKPDESNKSNLNKDEINQSLVDTNNHESVGPSMSNSTVSTNNINNITINETNPNVSSLTASDSNTTNNMTSSDVNLSDTIEPINENELNATAPVAPSAATNDGGAAAATADADVSVVSESGTTSNPNPNPIKETITNSIVEPIEIDLIDET